MKDIREEMSFIDGILICLSGATPILNGPILRETTTSIATVIGKIEHGLITTQTKKLQYGRGN